MVTGVYTFISFVCIYYLLLSVVDAVGSVRKYKAEIRKYKEEVGVSQSPSSIQIKFDSNLDLAVVAVIYLVSYYSGLFHG
jgi:hypothetical protein